MRRKIIGIFVCMLLILTIAPLSTTADNPIRKTITVDDGRVDYTNIQETIDNVEERDIRTHKITITPTYNLQVRYMHIKYRPIFKGDFIRINGTIRNYGDGPSPSYTVRNKIYSWPFYNPWWDDFDDEDYSGLDSHAERDFGPQLTGTLENDTGVYRLYTSIWVDGVKIAESYEGFIIWPKNRIYINTRFLSFLEQHPNLFPMLRHLLRL